MKISWIIKVTENCNLKCKYCYIYNLNTDIPSSKIIDIKTIEKLFLENIRLFNDIDCIWHGGEPLLANIEFFEEILNLQEFFNKRKLVNFVNKIQTNATLIDNAWINLFKKGSFGIGISIDGYEKIHNTNRLFRNSQEGSFIKTYEGIKLIQKNALNFGTLSVITKNSLNHEKELFEFFITNGIKKVDFLPLRSNIVNKSLRIDDESLSSGEYAKFINNFFDIWIKYNDPDFHIRIIEDTLMALLGGRPSLCRLNSTCQNYFTLSPSGDIFPCDKYYLNEKFIFGNILDGGFDKMLKNNSRKFFLNFLESIKDDCANCDFYKVCNGGCSFDHFHPLLKLYFSKKNCKDNKEIFSHFNKFLKSNYN